MNRYLAIIFANN